MTPAPAGGSLRVFEGHVYLHLPPEATDPRDFSLLDETENRWNRTGHPTLYLAGDLGVALAELGRHVGEEEDTSIVRRLFRFEVRLERVCDVRGDVAPAGSATGDIPAAASASLAASTVSYVDRDLACAAAERWRGDGARGLIVPSIAFLDQPRRFNLVVFLENAGDTAGWLRSFIEVGRVVAGPLASSRSSGDVAS